MSSHIIVGFNNLGQLMARYEIIEGVLPFLLVFTLIFAVLQRLNIFGENKKNIHIIISLIISVLTIVPHYTGRYSYNYDPVRIINALIPGAAVIAVAIILVLFLLGMFGAEFYKGGAPAWGIILILFILTYIFGTTVGWWTPPSATFDWWDSSTSMTIVAVLILGAIVLFITGAEGQTLGGGLVDALSRRIK